METRAMCVCIAVMLSLLKVVGTCQLYANGGIWNVDMGRAVGCAMACFGHEGQQVHILHETGIKLLSKQEKVFVMTSDMSDGLQVSLVLAAYQPISWIVQLSSSVNLTSVMLLSDLDFKVATDITIYGSDATPSIIRGYYPMLSYRLRGNIIRLAERQYGLVTSYTEAEHAQMWRLQEVPNIWENPCLPADWIVLRAPPYPHPTLPPIPTELVTVTVSTIGSVFIAAFLTVVLGFVPLFLCLCCLCFRARRHRPSPGGATSDVNSAHASCGGVSSSVFFAGSDPGTSDPPPAYELEVRPALPPAPPDYEKVNDYLPPPYSAVVTAMKTENMLAARV